MLIKYLQTSDQSFESLRNKISTLGHFELIYFSTPIFEINKMKYKQIITITYI